MIETVIIAFVVAKIKGYKIKPLFKDWAIYPAMSFVLAYVVLQAMIFLGIYGMLKYAFLFKPLFLMMFIIPMVKYNQYIAGMVGSGFVIAGTILNKIVMAANNGKMPVFATFSKITGYVKPNTVYDIDNIHCLGTSATKLKFLTDIFDVGYSVMSLGDILIRTFVFIIIYSSIRYLNTRGQEVMGERE